MDDYGDVKLSRGKHGRQGVITNWWHEGSMWEPWGSEGEAEGEGGETSLVKQNQTLMLPGKHDELNQFRFDVGPESQTLAHLRTGIGSALRACWLTNAI